MLKKICLVTISALGFSIEGGAAAEDPSADTQGRASGRSIRGAGRCGERAAAVS
ncbi:MAG: hypothetical protein LBF66_00580 [Holosporales bacterium]|nr:hypothetical protein [Holosporales bacterium]